MYVRAGRPAFARPNVWVHRSTSLMSSSLLLQQCPVCLIRLTWIVFVMGGRWLYSWCLVGCCLQDLFNIARSIKKKRQLIQTWKTEHPQDKSISRVGRGFPNDPGDQDSIPGLVIRNTYKGVLYATFLNTQNYKLQIKVKWSNPGKTVGSSPNPQCSSYWKGSLWVDLDCGRPTLLFTEIKLENYPEKDLLRDFKLNLTL